MDKDANDMDFSQLFKTIDTVTPGCGTGIFTPTHFTVLFFEFLFIALMAQKFRRLDEEKRKRMLRRLALFIIINEILKDLYLLLIGQLQWSNLPFHLCGINVIVVAVHLLTGKRKRLSGCMRQVFPEDWWHLSARTGQNCPFSISCTGRQTPFILLSSSILYSC